MPQAVCFGIKKDSRKKLVCENNVLQHHFLTLILERETDAQEMSTLIKNFFYHVIRNLHMFLFFLFFSFLT